VAITAPAEARVKRLMARDGISEEYAKKRIAAQHSEGWFREKCDYVLENNDTLHGFTMKCLAFLRELCIIDA
jgi:dephospho-CoA kinase